MNQETGSVHEDVFDFSCPSPIEDGINTGYKDGLIQGRKEGKEEGFREGFKAGHDFGMKIARLLVPLIKIIKYEENVGVGAGAGAGVTSTSDLEISQSLINELCLISLKNEEDSEKESRILQLEARIKVLLANFMKKSKNSSFKVQLSSPHSTSSNNQLSF